MRPERAGSERIQIRHRVGIDCDANADPAETIANAEIFGCPKSFTVAEDGAIKIDTDSVDSARLMLPA